MPTNPKHSILIVDDEPDVLFSLTGLLRRDFQVYTAVNGEQALEVMAEHPVHVIMTDQRMPEMTGIELMGRVRSEHPEAIRIIFTGYADTRAIVDAINTGGLYRYITKPWDPDDLVQVLRDAAKQYDATIAQSDLLRSLSSYLADIEEIVQAAEVAEWGPGVLDRFHSRTDEIRSLLQRTLGT